MGGIYQFKITLVGSTPAIWRRVLVPSDVTLEDLHLVIQCVMDWENYHLYAFECRGKRYHYDGEELRGLSLPLSKLDLKIKDTITYEYDFGDSWIHRLLLEKILPKDAQQTYPYCTTGKRSAPPEDSGGIWGYDDKLSVLKEGSGEDYEELLEWIGADFDPNLFDRGEVNRRLKGLAK